MATIIAVILNVAMSSFQEMWKGSMPKRTPPSFNSICQVVLEMSKQNGENTEGQTDIWGLIRSCHMGECFKFQKFWTLDIQSLKAWNI